MARIPSVCPGETCHETAFLDTSGTVVRLHFVPLARQCSAIHSRGFPHLFRPARLRRSINTLMSAPVTQRASSGVSPVSAFRRSARPFRRSLIAPSAGQPRSALHLEPHPPAAHRIRSTTHRSDTPFVANGLTPPSIERAPLLSSAARCLHTSSAPVGSSRTKGFQGHAFAKAPLSGNCAADAGGDIVKDRCFRLRCGCGDGGGTADSRSPLMHGQRRAAPPFSDHQPLKSARRLAQIKGHGPA